MPELSLNGESHRFAVGQTLLDLLRELGLDVGTVAVERNLEIVPRASYERCVLAQGDKLEIVTFVGGG